ncbi:unnamed protein product, partial [Linum tenue]
ALPGRIRPRRTFLQKGFRDTVRTQVQWHHGAGTTILISVSYFSVTALTIYTQILTQEALLPEPAMDLRLYGVVLFSHRDCWQFLSPLLTLQAEILRRRWQEERVQDPQGWDV